MNEGIGSTIIIVIIVVFIVFVSGYMAYNVNYTKAFRMKDKLVTTYEKYNGVCTDENGCKGEIKKYAQEIGYNCAEFVKDGSFCTKNGSAPSGTKVDSKETIIDPGYCVYKIKIPKTSSKKTIVSDKSHSADYYYRFVTVIHIEVPIIQNIMEFNSVTGDTKTFRAK